MLRSLMRINYLLPGMTALLLSVTAGLRAAEQEQAPDKAPKPYMRVRETAPSAVQLDIALRKFEADGKPTIWLAGVAHLGTAPYYEALQQFLDEQELVLFEGIGSPAFADRGEADDATRIVRTNEALAYVSALIELHRTRAQALPDSLEALREKAPDIAPRAARWLGAALVDGWGRGLRYEKTDDGFALRSLGADGAEGGEGAAADLAHTDVEPAKLTEGDAGLQGSLADGLGLLFQLDAIDYDRPTFRPCDMTVEQLRAALGGGDRAEGGQPRGEGDPESASQFNRMLGMLSGESMLSNVLKFAMTLIRANPRWQEIVRVSMVEMLGSLEGDLANNPALPPHMRQLMRTLIHDRNTVVLGALKAEAARADGPKSIAVFYGAGHMDDLERRLVSDLGYRPAGDRWLTAFDGDGRRAGMTDQQVTVVRQMIQRQMSALRGQ